MNEFWESMGYTTTQDTSSFTSCAPTVFKTKTSIHCTTESEQITHKIV